MPDVALSNMARPAPPVDDAAPDDDSIKRAPRTARKPSEFVREGVEAAHHDRARSESTRSQRPSPAYAQSCPPVMHYVLGGVDNPDAHGVPTPPGQARTVIRHPASLAPVGTVGGDASLRAGERNLNAAARSFRAQCPNSRIEVTGASMGALVAGNVRDQWQSDPAMRRNARFVLISDPRDRYGAMSRLPSFIPGFTHTGPRPSSTIPTSSVCRDNDLICTTGNVFQNPGHAINAAIGYLNGAHGYAPRDVNRAPGKHDLPASAHVVPSTPLPWNPPTAKQVFEPIVQAVVPDVPISPVYVPTPVKAFVPKAVRHLVPKQIGSIVLPPIR